MTNPYEVSPAGVSTAEELSTECELACPGCGCDLSGKRVTRCPECGVYFDAATMSRRQQRFLAKAHWPPERARWAVAAAGLSLLPFLWIATSVTTGNPTWWKPFPLTICIATVFFLNSQIGVFLVASVVVFGSFGLYTWPLMKGQPRIPWWSLVTFAFLHGLNCLHLLANYSRGVRTQGATHTNLVCIITGLLFWALVLLAVRNAWRPNFVSAVTFHWIAWFWLVLYLFPLLGPFMTLR